MHRLNAALTARRHGALVLRERMVGSDGAKQEGVIDEAAQEVYGLHQHVARGRRLDES